MRKKNKNIGKGWHKVKVYGDFRDKMKLHPETIMFKEMGYPKFLDNDMFPKLHCPLKFKECYLSIQCSGCHYCLPRATFDDVKKYSAMEIAFLSKHGSDWANINSILSDELIKELGYNDDDVFGYVPIELIQKVYDYMMKNYK